MTVLLISATAPEQQALAAALEAPVRWAVGGRRWSRGQLRGRAVQLAETGLGAVNTAHALTRALEAEPFEWVLQVGVGGAYDGAGLAVGDLAVATEEVYGDLGVITPAGWRPADEIGIPVARHRDEVRFNRFPVDGPLSRQAAQLLASSADAHAAAGVFVTVQTCSGTHAAAAELAARVPGALCESMEGAAAAHVCGLYGARLVEVRGISNAVGDRDRTAWDLPLAGDRAQAAALQLLDGLRP